MGRPTIAELISDALEQARADRAALPQGEESRRLAIIITQLEIIHAFAAATHSQFQPDERVVEGYEERPR